MRLNTRLRVAALLGSALCGSGIAAAVEETGSEPVQVSSGATRSPQHRPIVPDVAALPSGEKLVAWLQPIDREVPQRYQLWVRALDRTNAPVGSPASLSVVERGGQKVGVSDAAVQRTQRGFLVLWAEGTGGPFDTEVVGVRLRADGEPADRRFSVAARGTSPAFAYNAERREPIAVWTVRRRQIRARRLAADGSAIGDSFRLWRNPDADAIGAFGPAVAYDPRHDRYLAVWSGDEKRAQIVFGRTVPAEPSGRLGRTTRLGRRSSVLTLPDLAFSPRRSEFLLASQDDGEVLLTRVDSHGRRAGKDLRIPGSSDDTPASFPSIAATSAGEHVLTYNRGETLYYRRLGPRLRIGRERRVWTGPKSYESSRSAVTSTADGLGVAWVQAVGPDDDEGPQFHYADREVFFRELSARR